MVSSVFFNSFSILQLSLGDFHCFAFQLIGLSSSSSSLILNP